MRVHLLSVPNTPTCAGYDLDGFWLRTRLFAALLDRLGHEVILYGGAENDTPCDSFVSCLTNEDYATGIGTTPYQCVEFSHTHPLFVKFNVNAANAIRANKQPGDVLATIGGTSQYPVWEQNPELKFLEYSIGYRGITAPYRVYQSAAWRHVVHGFTGIDGGREFDTVIPPWFDAQDFPTDERPEPYVLYVGRIVSRKGIRTACEAAEHAGIKLLVVGHGDPSLITYGELLGPVSTPERNKLMARARAVLMPTQYLEPFGNVSAEAQLCGTPVISTDYGGFTESVANGISGFRCSTLGEFVQAIGLCADLDRLVIRLRARSLYSTDAAVVSYTQYFRRLTASQGWHSLAPGLDTALRAMSPTRTDYGFDEPVSRTTVASQDPTGWSDRHVWPEPVSASTTA